MPIKNKAAMYGIISLPPPPRNKTLNHPQTQIISNMEKKISKKKKTLTYEFFLFPSKSYFNILLTWKTNLKNKHSMG